MSIRRSVQSSTLLALALAVAAGPVACGGGGGGSRGGKKSEARKWIDSPSGGQKQGNKILLPQIGVEFEIPETLYVFKSC